MTPLQFLLVTCPHGAKWLQVSAAGAAAVIDYTKLQEMFESECLVTLAFPSEARSKD